VLTSSVVSNIETIKRIFIIELFQNSTVLNSCEELSRTIWYLLKKKGVLKVMIML